MPDARVAATVVFTLTVTLAGAMPVGGVTDSQPPPVAVLNDTVKGVAAPLATATAIVCGAGVAPPFR